MKTYKVDKGIPIAESRIKSKWQDLLRSMSKGDSVYFPTHKEAHGFCAAVWRSRGKGHLIRRPEGEGYRVWRVV